MNHLSEAIFSNNDILKLPWQQLCTFKLNCHIDVFISISSQSNYGVPTIAIIGQQSLMDKQK